MPNYDYINARLRGMRRRLLGAEGRKPLKQTEDIEEFLNALAQTPYQEAVADARLTASGLSASMLALQHAFERRIEKVRGLFNGDALPIDILLYRYDAHNVLTILHGLANDVPKNRILGALMPVSLVERQVFEHAIDQADAWQAARDVLLTLVEEPWRPALTERTIQAIEAALDQWYFSQEAGQELVAEVLRRQADQHNIMEALRDGERFVPLGHIAEERLADAAQTDSIEGGVRILAKSTTYRRPLQAGLNAYRRTERLSEIENALTEQRLAWQQRQIRLDPLGVGVVVGYLGGLLEDIRALRLIAQEKGLRI